MTYARTTWCCALLSMLTLAACSKPADLPMAAAEPDQPAQPVPPRSADELLAGKLDQAIAGSWRPAADKARDPFRHPRPTLDFFGIKPTMTVIEVTPGGGWYAQILAPFLKGSGHYIAAETKPKDANSEAAHDKTALQKMFDGDAAQYGEAKTIEFDPKAPSLGPPASADMVLTFRNVHNWIGGDTAPLMFKAFFDVLKPGGVLGVVDHRAAAGSNLDAVKGSGYLPQEFVIKLATDAGFTLADQSDINANPADTKDYAKGVWTLPPTLRLGEQDRAKYMAIGESDRMTLKFVKPASDQIFSPDQEQGKPVPAKP